MGQGRVAGEALGARHRGKEGVPGRGRIVRMQAQLLDGVRKEGANGVWVQALPDLACCPPGRSRLQDHLPTIARARPKSQLHSTIGTRRPNVPIEDLRRQLNQLSLHHSASGQACRMRGSSR